jgi:hypothetical protein
MTTLARGGFVPTTVRGGGRLALLLGVPDPDEPRQPAVANATRAKAVRHRIPVGHHQLACGSRGHALVADREVRPARLQAGGVRLKPDP